MNKSELIDEVASKVGVSKSDADAVITGMFQVLEDCMSKGEKVTVPGYLTMERTLRSARKGRNPRTGEEIQIAAAHSCKVSAGSKLKAAAKG